MHSMMSKQKKKPDAQPALAQALTDKASDPGNAAALGAGYSAGSAQGIFGGLKDKLPAAEREADQIASGVTAQARTPDAVKAQLGQQMGADFSDVRFHVGADAEEKAEGMGARAYATGRDVFFGEGGFDPAIAAHELVHTVQQGGVDSGVSTVSAPAGSVQMLPKWADFKRGLGNAKTVMGYGARKAGHGIASGAKATAHGIASGAKATAHGVKSGVKAAGHGIGNAWGRMKQALTPVSSISDDEIRQEQTDLEGVYSREVMAEKIKNLLPVAQPEIAKVSANLATTDGNRFAYLRRGTAGPNGDERGQYCNMLLRSTRSTNTQLFQTLLQNQREWLPDISGLYDGFNKTHYKNLVADENKKKYGDKAQNAGLNATQQYLSLLEQNPDGIDALKQSASGLYGKLGGYSEQNKAGLVGGKLEASHRAMNDMIIRSMGSDTLNVACKLQEQNKLTNDEAVKIQVLSEAIAAMQPKALTVAMNPNEMQNLSPQEQEVVALYHDFFQRNGML